MNLVFQPVHEKVEEGCHPEGHEVYALEDQ